MLNRVPAKGFPEFMLKFLYNKWDLQEVVVVTVKVVREVVRDMVKDMTKSIKKTIIGFLLGQKGAFYVLLIRQMSALTVR